MVKRKNRTEDRSMRVIASVLFIATFLAANSGTAGESKNESSFFTLSAKVEKASNGKRVLVVTAKATPGYHCNLEYPWKLDVRNTERVGASKARYRLTDAKTVSDDKVVFRVPIQPQSGVDTVSIKLKFGMCDAKQCYMKTVEQDVAVK